MDWRFVQPRRRPEPPPEPIGHCVYCERGADSGALLITFKDGPLAGKSICFDCGMELVCCRTRVRRFE